VFCSKIFLCDTYHQLVITEKEYTITVLPDDIYVALVDDDKKTREGLSWLLDASEGIKCVGTFAHCTEALEGISDAAPDVVLMDIGMPGQTGIECVELLGNEYPELKILMLTNYSDPNRIFDSLRAGAVGYLLKNSGIEKICEAIRDAYHGGAPMSGEIAKKVMEYFRKQKKNSELKAQLSSRETDVLDALTNGLSDRAISEKLFISIPTVRFHLKNIYAKLHVNSRSEAVMRALKDNIL
jgi:DNA-binding NarL/FixJ family response regulator